LLLLLLLLLQCCTNGLARTRFQTPPCSG
jgi:hypothetical protein